MRRNVIDLVPPVLQHRAIVFQVRPHPPPRRSARHRLNRSVHPLHQPPRRLGPLCIHLRRHLPRLPRPIHLIAQTPRLHPVRPRLPVRPALVRPIRRRIQVAVLHQVHHIVQIPRTQIHRHHRRGPCRLAPRHELIRPEVVRLHRMPGIVRPRRPLLLRPHPILPVVARHKIPPRIPHQRHPQRRQRRDHILPKSPLIRPRRSGIVNPLIHAPPQVLRKPRENPPIDRAHLKLRVELNCRCHVYSPAKNPIPKQYR